MKLTHSLFCELSTALSTARINYFRPDYGLRPLRYSLNPLRHSRKTPKSWAFLAWLKAPWRAAMMKAAVTSTSMPVLTVPEC